MKLRLSDSRAMLAVGMAGVCLSATAAPQYLVVIPVPGKTVRPVPGPTTPVDPEPPVTNPEPSISISFPPGHLVTWDGEQLFESIAGGVMVTGDPQYRPDLLVFSNGSSLPSELLLGEDGTLYGRLFYDYDARRASYPLDLVVQYKGKQATSVFTIQVNPREFSMPDFTMPMARRQQCYSADLRDYLMVDGRETFKGFQGASDPGAVRQVRFVLAEGSILPPGLYLSSTGEISGRLNQINIATVQFQGSVFYGASTQPVATFTGSVFVN